ncbi:MAG: 3-dehydroquinate synthase II [Armatimonadota bacterium]|nr:MAG: 3-dehydroquinate synthase II [Armatimonadota bacterium]
MKHIWVKIDPWDEALAGAALESGADAVVLAAGDTPKMKALGALPTVAPDGDIVPGTDVFWMEIRDKADEEAAAATHLDKTVVLKTSDWTVIPLENLIARRGNLMAEIGSAPEARLVIAVLEKGVDGVVLESRSAEAIRETVELVHSISPTVELVAATVTSVRPLGMGDRSCVDTCTQMGRGEGMLVGNSGRGFLLVHSESLETPYVAARPFRVNAGAIHAYVYLPDGATRYLSELKAGDEVLLVRATGETSVAYVGRNKIERRPLLLVEAEAAGETISLVLQNAETIRLTTPEGEAVSVAELQVGDQVLAHLEKGGRHFGTAVDETIVEQ